jgi:hypothetical protein
MSVVFPILLLLILIGCIGFLYTEGMWGNGVRLINVVTAALLATNFFEPLAKLLEEKIYEPASYLWDLVALWALFGVFLVIFRMLTGSVSRVKVRFLGIADRIGSAVFATLIGCMMVCFVTMTLHTAPLGETFIWDGFDADESETWGFRPGHRWMRFAEWTSKGCFSPFGGDESDVFDGGAFITAYAARRAELESHVESSGGGPKALLVTGGGPPR